MAQSADQGTSALPQGILQMAPRIDASKQKGVFAEQVMDAVPEIFPAREQTLNMENALQTNEAGKANYLLHRHVCLLVKLTSKLIV